MVEISLTLLCIFELILQAISFFSSLLSVPIDGRTLTFEGLSMEKCNVILNDHDVSEYLKISADGLEVSSSVQFSVISCHFFFHLYKIAITLTNLFSLFKS